jgi:hypothetical protein
MNKEKTYFLTHTSSRPVAEIAAKYGAELLARNRLAVENQPEWNATTADTEWLFKIRAIGAIAADDLLFNIECDMDPENIEPAPKMPVPAKPIALPSATEQIIMRDSRVFATDAEVKQIYVKDDGTYGVFVTGNAAHTVKKITYKRWRLIG